jgi:hypothetical protein
MVEVHRRFGGTCRLHLSSAFLLVSCLAYLLSPLKGRRTTTGLHTCKTAVYSVRYVLQGFASSLIDLVYPTNILYTFRIPSVTHPFNSAFI